MEERDSLLLVPLVVLLTSIVEKIVRLFAALSPNDTADLCMFNPLVPRVQKIKICNLTLNRLLIVEFVK